MLDGFQLTDVDVTLLAVFSLLSLLISLVVVAWVLCRIPEDYFAYESAPPTLISTLPYVLRIIFLLLKNILGYCCLIIGFILLILPGQGLLMILVAIMLLNFPGKYRCERWLIKRAAVLKTVNYLRRLGKRSPLQLH